MLNSFWNLCRICPSMPTEKFNSEYKTHFKWHDSSYHAPIQEAIKRQTEPSTQEPGSEPALSRKKKYPDLAYRTHQVLRMVKSDGLDSLEMLALTNNRARSEERGNRRGSLRSRSVDPYLGRRQQPTLMTQSYPPAGHPSQDGASNIPKTTEYRSQFAWPPGGVAQDKLTSPPRKSISMGTIQTGPEGGEKHVVDGRMDSPYYEENLDSVVRALEEQIIVDGHVEEPGKRKKFKTEYKARFKSPSKYICVDGSWIKTKDGQVEGPKVIDDTSWYGEVLELRRKAGEYKIRSLGTAIPIEQATPAYLAHQEELWKQVSQRSSLSALALAATPREKEQNAKAVKDKENLRQARLAKPRAKSALPQVPRPRKPRPPSHVIPRTESARTPTRHHLERTTPTTDGSLLMSPTRDHKLEPLTTTSPKSKPGSKAAPGDVSRRSPKHTPRAHSVASTQRIPDSKKQQRPTSLASIPKPKAKPKEVPQDDSLAKTHLPVKSIKPKAKIKEEEEKKEGSKENVNEEKIEGSEEEMKMNLINGITSEQPKGDLESPPTVKSPEQAPLIKSPPEPTRVKSPEQISAKSPEPVKWTIPLDTGIKWTENLIIDTDGSVREKISPSFHPPITDTVSLSKSSPVTVLPETHRLPVVSPSSGRSLASEVMDRARTRFDQFWGTDK